MVRKWRLVGVISEIDTDRKLVELIEQRWNKEDEEWEDGTDAQGNILTYVLTYDQDLEEKLDKAFENSDVITVKVHENKIVKIEGF
jgi:hypothetical protein